MPWNPELLAAQYQPRPCDASREDYQARLQACLPCPSRVGSRCELIQQIATVHARQARSQCPLSNWPGDKPPVAKRDPQKPRVAMIVPHWWCGGVERQTITLIRHSRHLIDWAGVWIHSFTTCHPAMVEELRSVTATTVGVGYLPTDADLVIVWGFREPQAWFRKYSGKIITTSHGCNEWNQQQLRVVAPHCCGGVAVSVQAQADLETLGIPSIVIPNAVDPERLIPTETRQETRERLGIGKRVALGYVGRISDEKEPIAPAKACGYLPPETAVAVMHGPHFLPRIEAEFRQQAEAYNPGNNIWVSEQEHTANILQALDYLIVASPKEGFGLAMAEAMWMGVPVIATDVGYLPEYEQQHGYLRHRLPAAWNGRDVANIVLAGQPDAFVAKAREVARQHFRPQAMAAAWANYLRSLVPRLA